LPIVCQDQPTPQHKVGSSIAKLDHERPQLSTIYQPETLLNQKILACPARFERATYALEGRKLISYKRLFMADSGLSAVKKSHPA